MSTEATVFFVDDEPAVRESLVYLLESVGLSVETFESAEAFLETFEPTRPGCLLIDIRLPGMDGLALQRELVDRGWRVPIVVVSAHGDIAMAVAAMRAGAVDYLQKPFDDAALVQSVQQAIEIDVRRRERNRERQELLERLRTLTSREREVLDRVVEGESTKEISGNLGTSFNTVQNQRASIMHKMRARSVADLVRMVMVARMGDL